MQNQLPYIISITELQRNPSILSHIDEDRYIVITKGSKKIGVFLPMKIFEQYLKMLENINSIGKKNNKYELSHLPKLKLSESNPFGYHKANSAEKQVNELAGSVRVPEEYKNVPIEDIIATAKRNYFKMK